MWVSRNFALRGHRDDVMVNLKGDTCWSAILAFRVLSGDEILQKHREETAAKNATMILFT